MHTLCYSVFKRQLFFFFFQAEDGIRDLVRSRGLGDVYKRQFRDCPLYPKTEGWLKWTATKGVELEFTFQDLFRVEQSAYYRPCLLYTSDAADERSSVDLGGRRIIKQNNPTTPPPHPVQRAI